MLPTNRSRCSLTAHLKGGNFFLPIARVAHSQFIVLEIPLQNCPLSSVGISSRDVQRKLVQFGVRSRDVRQKLVQFVVRSRDVRRKLVKKLSDDRRSSHICIDWPTYS